MYYDHEVQLSQQSTYIPAIKHKTELRSPYLGAHDYGTAHASNYNEKNAWKHKNQEVNHYYENIEVYSLLLIALILQPLIS